jgi:hypothetical protein
LAREAWFYEEMEDIQGVSIARCYGFFTAEIDPNSQVLDWAESDADYDEEVDVRDEDSQSPDDYDSDAWDSSRLAEFYPYDLGTTEFTWEMAAKLREEAEEKAKLKRQREDKPHPIIRSTRPEPSPVRNGDEKTFLSVLVLERLGDVIPLDVPLEAVKSVWPALTMHASELPLLCRPDVHEIYSDMGRFGVEHIDIRWRNILAAPAAQRSIVCPYHGHPHQWRVVDFDRSRKSNFLHTHIEHASGSWLRTILGGLEKGYVVERWD